MLTENARLPEIVVFFAMSVVFAGLFLWIITGNNKRLAKEAAEDVKEYMDEVDKPKSKYGTMAEIRKSIRFLETKQMRATEDKDFDKEWSIGCDIQKLREELTSLEVNQGYKDEADSPIRDVDGLTEEDRELRKRISPRLEDHSRDSFEYYISREGDKHRINPPGDWKSHREGHVHLDFNPKAATWVKDMYAEEHILDKINRLHREMQECLPVENYERMAVIKKELNELYEAKPPKDFKF